MIRFTVAIVLAVLTAGATAQTGDLDEARRLLREGQHAQALSALDARLATDPDDSQARFLKGVALAESRDAEGAIREFTRLTREHPELPEPYNNLAVVYASRGEYEKARDALQQAIETHPSYATAHENLGDIYAKMAGLAYTRALSLDTGNAAAKQKLALIDDLFTRRAATGGTAPAAAPSPVAEPSPRAVTPAQDDIVEAVQRWAAAWSAQDVAAYLDAYASGGSPDPALERAEWERQRRARLAKPAYIRVDVERLEVRRAGADRATVTFEQVYRSDTYQDRVRKELTLRREGNRWRILAERTLGKLS